ncbi:putative disease resistance RPP13-like protein 3 [Fagus crenata]
MADSVVSFLLANLTQLLTQESNLLGGVQDQVRILNNELEMISVFLQSTEGKRDDNLVKVVVSQIRDVAYEIEDVIDTYIMTATKHSKRSKLRKLIYCFDRVTTLHEVASKTESIKQVIKEIYNNRSKYGIIEIAQSGGGDAQAQGILQKRRRYVEEDEVVGFGHDTQALLKQLLEGGLQRDVTSIIAELKEELFHGLEVKYSTLFEDLQCMKEKDDGEFKDILLQKVELMHGRKSRKSFLDFLQNIYKRNGDGLQDMNDDELKSTLFNFLQGKRYLIVLDDIWKTDVWDELKVAFPDNVRGSRILITSRIKEVAAHASPNIPPYFLPFLNKDESWELFSKKVFREESIEEKFLEVCSDFNLLHMSKSRRLSINCATPQYISSNLCDSSSNCRSLLSFGFENKSNLEWLCKMFKLVRVVDSGDTKYSSIPKKIEKLILLRYLRIPGNLDVIPASICSLWNLVTLDVRSCTTYVLPKEIWMLQKLRHLYLRGPTSIPRTDNKALPNLQVLTGIDINEDTNYLFAKARFPNLRKLGLHNLIFESGLPILSSLSKLRQLQTLKIYRLCHLPQCSIHSTLTKVTLVEVPELYKTVFTMLGNLPNLRILKLRGVSRGGAQSNLHCSESSFRQLEVFVMAHLRIINWELKKGAMPSLRRLVIDRCHLLEFPKELWCLTALRDVQVLQPSPELANTLQRLQMKNGCKLQVYPPLESGPGLN